MSYWTTNQEREAEKLLEKLQQMPFAKEYNELGHLLMKHKSTFTADELNRYNELLAILSSNPPQDLSMSEQNKTDRPMTPDNMEQKAMEWYLRRMKMENEPPDIIEAAKTIDHVKANVEMLAAFARSLAPLPLSMTEEEIDRIGREQYPPDTTNDGEPWYNHEQATRNMYFKDGLRYASTHTKTITVDEILELVKENDMDAEGDESFTNESHWANLHNRLTSKFK